MKTDTGSRSSPSQITLTAAQAAVTDFHRAIGARVGTRPSLLRGEPAAANSIAADLRTVEARCREIASGNDEFLLRLAMAVEELAEWAEAHATGNLIAAADAWGDRLYVLLGDAVTAGLPGEAIFGEVHRSNMTKTDTLTGGDGKAGKGQLYSRPRLASLVNQANS